MAMKGCSTFPKISSVTGTSPSDCLVSYQDTRWEGFLFAEVQSVYSTAPADWARWLHCLIKCIFIYIWAGIYIYIYIYYLLLVQQEKSKYSKMNSSTTTWNIKSLNTKFRLRRSWYNGYRFRKWIGWPKFKFWKKLFAFHAAIIITLGKGINPTFFLPAMSKIVE